MGTVCLRRKATDTSLVERVGWGKERSFNIGLLLLLLFLMQLFLFEVWHEIIEVTVCHFYAFLCSDDGSKTPGVCFIEKKVAHWLYWLLLRLRWWRMWHLAFTLFFFLSSFLILHNHNNKHFWKLQNFKWRRKSSWLDFFSA